MLVDSHCHLNYLDDPDARLNAARAVGVDKFLCINVDQQHFCEVQSLSQRHDDVWATAGVHPDSIVENISLEWVETALFDNKIVGVGETGLDYSRLDASDSATRKHQCQSFEQHLFMAGKHGLPIVVHTRDASQDTLACMKNAATGSAAVPAPSGVMHCFTESWELAEASLDLGYYISMSGIVTFKNAASVREVAIRVPSDRLLVETDCPWLAPVPHRGHTNEPAFVKDTARFLADLRGISFEELAHQTSTNFMRLFDKIGAN